MFMLTLRWWSVLLPLSNAAALAVTQFDADNTDLPKGLTWEKVDVPVHGQTPLSVTVACNARFGVGLDARSCFDTLRWAPDSTVQETWIAADKSPPPVVHGGVSLPAVVVNNATSCLIEPTIYGPATLAHASAHNVSTAARALITGCVIPRGLGGIAQQIGGDNKLSVMLTTGPSVPPACRQPIRATPRSCQYILDEMSKGSAMDIFGKRGSPSQATITVSLPKTLRSPDGLCQILIDTKNLALVKTSWRRIWFGAQFINAHCVRDGKGGTISYGEKVPPGAPATTYNLFLEIMDEPAQLALPGGSAVSGQDDLAAAVI